jgi:hypothetical protein
VYFFILFLWTYLCHYIWMRLFSLRQHKTRSLKIYSDNLWHLIAMFKLQLFFFCSAGMEPRVLCMLGNALHWDTSGSQGYLQLMYFWHVWMRATILLLDIFREVLTSQKYYFLLPLPNSSAYSFLSFWIIWTF